MRNPDYQYFVGWEDLPAPLGGNRTQVEMSTNSLEAAEVFFRCEQERILSLIAKGEVSPGETRLFLEAFDGRVYQETII